MVNTIDDDYRLLERIRRGEGLEPLHDTNRDNSRLRSENDAKRRVMRTDEAFKLLRNAAWLGTNDERDATEEAVARACNALANIEQITWERDTAIDQLRMLGYSLGEKPRKNGDLINRQAAIDALNEYFERIGKLKRGGLTKGEKAISLDTVGTIKSLPSAQPERKTGKWVHGREIAREMVGDAIAAIFYEGWQCSECKCIVEEEREPLWKFCPNCGADMRKETEDAEVH